MIQGRCPICSKAYQADSLDELPSFPFCSERCRLIDLGRWADGKYAIPGRPAPAQPEPTREDADDSD
jgi:endogenous inhibitor of DNA gyrase (YacG/DUF329 family)